MRALAFRLGVSSTLTKPALAIAAVVLCISAVLACGNHPAAKLVVRFDAGDDATADAALDAPSLPDGVPPDAGPLGDPCVDDAQCDDKIACTYDSCDKTYGRCRNVPDDTQCQDGRYCDGEEKCVPGHGCQPGPVVSCDDGRACEIARCDEPTKSCVYEDRDVDQDGDPDSHCPPGKDCNDLDPTVSSLHAEVCANGVDDNCNGQIDEQPCVVPQGQACDDAVATSGPGTYAMSTVGAGHPFATSCSVDTPSSAQDVVASITVPPGPNVDLEIWVTASVPVAAAIQRTCGDPSSEIACGAAVGASSVRARARNVPPGTYYAIATTQYPVPLDLKVSFLAPTSPPTDVDCASATPIQPGTPVPVSLVDAPTDLPTACQTQAGELTYSFALTQPQDVRVYASVVQGNGSPVIGLRAPSCSGAGDEIACHLLGQQAVFARALPPGTYVVTAGATASIDESFVVQLSAATTAPPDQTCAAPPAIAAGQKLAFDLSNNEATIQDGCALGPNAAFDMSLTAASDVLLVERIPQTESGAVSLDLPACDTSSVLSCGASGTPVRTGKRNVAPGDYRVVVSDQLGEQGSVEALVRPTVAPTVVAAGDADTCAHALDVSGGGFFTGDTSTASPDYGNGCDAPGQPTGGAPDQVLTLTLAQPQRVVLDMEGSAYTTILDVRAGSTCPGSPVANACYVGFGAQRSFLDLELTTGTYWIIVDGYQGAKGAWDLDVRILPP